MDHRIRFTNDYFRIGPCGLGQDINLTGEVTSSVKGLPLQGVIVTLKNNPQCIDTTGTDGTYQLLASTGVVHYFTEGKSFSGNR